jgi:putative ABC transport system permease protein
MSAIGIAIGLAGALVVTRYLQSLLFGVTPSDPLTFTIITALLLLTAALAAWLPARRAARIDPLISLRAE